MNELCETGNRRIDDLVAKDDGKWFIADQMLGAEHGMPESHGFWLADVAEVCEIRDVPHLVEHLPLAAALEIFFQLQRPVKVVFDRALTAAGDDDDVMMVMKVVMIVMMSMMMEMMMMI